MSMSGAMNPDAPDLQGASPWIVTRRTAPSWTCLVIDQFGTSRPAPARSTLTTSAIVDSVSETKSQPLSSREMCCTVAMICISARRASGTA